MEIKNYRMYESALFNSRVCIYTGETGGKARKPIFSVGLFASLMFYWCCQRWFFLNCSIAEADDGESLTFLL